MAPVHIMVFLSQTSSTENGIPYLQSYSQRGVTAEPLARAGLLERARHALVERRGEEAWHLGGGDGDNTDILHTKHYIIRNCI